MKILFQPPKSKICGHVCIAMIANLTVEDVVKVIGHKKGTNTKTVIKTLRHFGFTTASRLIPFKTQKLPDTCICKFSRLPKLKGNWHWIIHHKGMYYDPTHGILTISELHEKYINWKMTSFLEVS